MRILLAEDDRLAQRTAALALQGAGHDVEVVADGEQAWARLLADPDRLLVTDWMMPNMDGIELIRRVRAGTFSSYVYTILVTVLDDPSSVVRGLDAGADDHLGKPYDPRELVARVSVGERIVRLERELRASRGQLRDLATIDPLTGLLDHRAAAARLREEVARAADTGSQVCLALVSIDGLGRVARSSGRPRADTVLRVVSRALRSELRAYDTLGRWSVQPAADIGPALQWGEADLLLVLADMAPTQAAAEIARLRSTVSRFRFEIEGTDVFVPTLTVGLASAGAGHEPADVDALLDRARAALDAAPTECASA